MAMMSVFFDSKYDPTTTFSFSAMALGYVVAGFMLTRFSRVAAIVPALGAIGLTIALLFAPGGDVVPKTIVGAWMLFTFVPGIRGSFAYQRAYERGLREGDQRFAARRGIGTKVVAAYLLTVGVLYAALILPHRDTAATSSEPAAPSAPVEVSRATYVGTVSNHEFQQSSTMWLSARWFSDGSFKGCAAIYAPLTGSGTVTGIGKDGPHKFTIDSKTMSIDFEGATEGDQIQGTYVVRPKAADTTSPAGKVQQGDWSARLNDPKYGSLPLEDCPEQYTSDLR